VIPHFRGILTSTAYCASRHSAKEMNQSERLRVAVIGLGYWGPKLVRVFQADRRSLVTAVADVNIDHASAIKELYPSVEIYGSAADLILSGRADAVAIATPLESHFAIALQALNAGMHVFVEKPFTASPSEAEMLIAEADKRGLTILVDHTFVYHPAVVRLIELVKKDALGELLYFDSRRINLGLFRPDSDVVWDLAVHDLSILDSLLDDAPVSISAIGAAHIEGHPHNTAFITLQYANKFVAHVGVNWMSPVKVRQLLVGGSKKMVIYDDLTVENRLRIYDCGVEGLNASDPEYLRRVEYRVGDMWAPQISSSEPLAEAASHFIDCIKGAAVPRSDGAAGLRVVRLLDAASKSLHQGGAPVRLVAA
jgi:predicted dehydrogenase